MNIMLTSCFCDFHLVDGKEAPSVLIRRNGLLDTLQSIWAERARVLVVCSDPCNHAGNDAVCACMKESFLMSGLSIGTFALCDGRNPDAVCGLQDVDVLVLAGGHVPTQNAFMKQLGLREKLRGYDGVILALSAGSMNCAETVYAIPELAGEAVNPHYERWLTGLGLTTINIFPHYQYLKTVELDGLCMASDIAFPDSYGKEILALNDGSYLLLSDGNTTLYGEAYRIRDGKEYPLCKDGEWVSLS